jgi:hypothetical protein
MSENQSEQTLPIDAVSGRTILIWVFGIWAGSG